MSRRPTDHPTTVDDAPWLAARIAPQQTAIFYHGTEGNDRLFGSNFDDYFDVSQGGDDRAISRGGDDVFYFGAAFTGADRADGGDGTDIVIFDGDYSSPVVVGKSSLVNVELLGLNGGSFDISGYLNFSVGGRTFVDATSLTKHQSLNLAVKSADLLDVRGGAGDDVIHGALNRQQSFLSGGDGDDVLIGEGGWTGFFGGAGADQMVIANRKDSASFVSKSDSSPGSYDVIDGFRGRADDGRNVLYLGFDSNDSNDIYERSFHLGETPGHSGDIIVHYDAALDHTVVEIYTNPDAIADFELHLTGNVTLAASDFQF